MPNHPRDQLNADSRLRISEIFYSLQGEADSAGLPTVFVRLTGCPLRCQYCDTEYAFHGGGWMSFEEIVETVAEHGAESICVTGGEPLAQKNCHGLLTVLCDRGYRVSLETSGAIDITDVDKRVTKVLDIKTPGSGEEARNLWDNISQLGNRDQIKFVICDRNDYEWARKQIAERNLIEICTNWLSPSHRQLQAADLAEWILEDHLPVRLQVQLHKILWGEERGR